jgi:hypothetical protein
MTAQEMQYHFELKLNQFYKIEKVYSSTDVAVFLNLAQDDLINERYSKLLGDKGVYFESDEKTRLELGSLIKNQVITSFITSNAALHPNGVFANLASDFLYSLQEMCVVGYSDCNSDSKTGIAKVLPVRHDEYVMNIDNPFGQPYNKLVWRMDYGSTGTKKHELIHGVGNTISSYTLRYLRKPTTINILTGVDCELHVNLHEEIVDRAIIIALAMISQLNKNVEPKKVTNES